MFEKIKKWYCMGLWTASQVEKAEKKGVITAEQAAEILNEEESA